MELLRIHLDLPDGLCYKHKIFPLLTYFPNLSDLYLSGMGAVYPSLDLSFMSI